METRVRVYLCLIALVIAIGIPGFMITEGLSAIDALYFCIVTIATVGYGDVVPTTPAGKALAIFVILGGVGSFLGLVVNSMESWFYRIERQKQLKKLNLLIGAFFSVIGRDLLLIFSHGDPAAEEISELLQAPGEWTDRACGELKKALEGRDFRLDTARVGLEETRRLLVAHRDFLVRLLENPMILEKERFTDTLLALFHLAEELECREEFACLPASDLEHLGGDMARIYRLLVLEWVEYMRYLKEHYPYLFSLALRKNPFDHGASPVVRE